MSGQKDNVNFMQSPATSLPRVLVVDDDQDCADSLAELLQCLGAETRVVYGGAQALDELAGFQPRLVLLDIGMPGMDGFEAARRIRERPEGRDAFLVALTGWGRAGDRQRGRDAGFDLHMVKPGEIEALKKLLADLPR